MTEEQCWNKLFGKPYKISNAFVPHYLGRKNRLIWAYEEKIEDMNKIRQMIADKII